MVIVIPVSITAILIFLEPFLFQALRALISAPATPLTFFHYFLCYLDPTVQRILDHSEYRGFLLLKGLKNP